jgi:hypothetical protein
MPGGVQVECKSVRKLTCERFFLVMRTQAAATAAEAAGVLEHLLEAVADSDAAVRLAAYRCLLEASRHQPLREAIAAASVLCPPEGGCEWGVASASSSRVSSSDVRGEVDSGTDVGEAGEGQSRSFEGDEQRSQPAVVFILSRAVEETRWVREGRHRRGIRQLVRENGRGLQRCPESALEVPESEQGAALRASSNLAPSLAQEMEAELTAIPFELLYKVSQVRLLSLNHPHR